MKPVSLVVALLLAPTLCAAQATEPPPIDSLQAEARGLFAAGSAAYDRADYEAALSYFERAYELSQHPVMLYNIGHTAERLRRDERALEAFEAYLELVPDAANHATVVARAERLRRMIEEPDESEPDESESTDDAPAEVVVAEASADGGSVVGPIALIATGAALVVGGAVLLGVSVVSADSVSSSPEGTPWVDVAGDYDAAFYLSTFGFVALGVGAALAVSGIVWLVVGGSDEDVAVRVGPTGVSGVF